MPRFFVLSDRSTFKAGSHCIFFFKQKALFVYVFEENSPAPEENKETKLFARKKCNVNQPLGKTKFIFCLFPPT